VVPDLTAGPIRRDPASPAPGLLYGDPVRDWVLAVDFGTTATVAVIRDLDTGTVEVVDFSGTARLASGVGVSDSGELVAGALAERLAMSAPERVERAPKRRLGDRAVLLGDEVLSPVALVSAVLASAAAEARRQRGDAGPAALCLTHPAAWGSTRIAALSAAADAAGLPTPSFVAEPVAAALQLGRDAVEVGSLVLVYDFGGGTFDTALLQRVPDGFVLIGRPGGDDRLGGETLDERVREVVGRRIGERDPEMWEQLRFSEERPWRLAQGAFGSECRAAKERLSFATDTAIYVPSPADIELALTRAELEQAIRGDVVHTVDEAVATVERAGATTSDVAAVHLVGGTSRIPLITRLLSERFGTVPTTWGDPKAAVALGAAAAWRAGAGGLTAQPAVVFVVGGERLQMAAGGGLVGRADPPRGYLPEVDLTGHDPERSVSRRHAQVVVGPGGVELVDVGSANGTWVGGHRLDAGTGVVLTHGQVLRFGDVVSTVELTAR
jgi:molecular chaperone DnaK (HSP70)